MSMRLLATTCFVVCLGALTSACSWSENQARRAMDNPTTTLLGGLPTTTIASSAEAAAARLAGVNNRDLRMGADFNRRFLEMEFTGIGFDATETKCLTDAAVESQGAALETATLATLQENAPFTPERLLTCVPMSRMEQLSSGGTSMDFSRVDPAILRQTMGDLTTAALVAGGLSPVEATCVNERVSNSLDPNVALTDGKGVAASVLADALPNCLTDDRIGEVGR